MTLHLSGVNQSAGRVRVQECLTKPVHTVDPAAPLADAAKLMERYASHRLPVVKADQLVGVLSLSDSIRVRDERLHLPEWLEAERKVLEVVEAIATTQ